MSDTVRYWHALRRYSLGPVEPDTVQKVEIKVTDEERARLERVSRRPPLSEILNLHDFEVGPCSTLSAVPCLIVIGHCKTGHAGKSMGLLFIRCGR